MSSLCLKGEQWVLAKYSSAPDVLLLEDVNSAPRIWNHKVKVQVREKFNLRFPTFRIICLFVEIYLGCPKVFHAEKDIFAESLNANKLSFVGSKAYRRQGLYNAIYSDIYMYVSRHCC